MGSWQAFDMSLGFSYSSMDMHLSTYIVQTEQVFYSTYILCMRSGEVMNDEIRQKNINSNWNFALWDWFPRSVHPFVRFFVLVSHETERVSVSRTHQMPKWIKTFQIKRHNSNLLSFVTLQLVRKHLPEKLTMTLQKRRSIELKSVKKCLKALMSTTS